MVAVPAVFCAVIKPLGRLLSNLATLLLSVDQEQLEVTSAVVPSQYVTSAVYAKVVPMKIVSCEGMIVRLAGGFETVIVRVSETTPLPSIALALMVAVPALSPVKAPVRFPEETSAILSLPDSISQATLGNEGLLRGIALTSIDSPTFTLHFAAFRYILLKYVPVTCSIVESFKA